MPRPEERRKEILSFLYHESGEVSARDLMEKLQLPKQTVYQVIEDLNSLGYLDITIDPTDRVRRYKLKENYREWYKHAEDLDIPLPFEERRRPLEAVNPEIEARAELSPLPIAPRASPISAEPRKKKSKRKSSKR